MKLAQSTINRPTLTCSICPFARYLDGNRYVCGVPETAADVVRGHWESKASCHEAIAQAEAPATVPAPTAPAAIGRGRVQPIAKTDKALAAIFGERHKQYQQFLIIREEFSAIGIKVGKLIKSRSDVKGWRLDWSGDKAGLFWSVGDGWDVEALISGDELNGNWEGFDLIKHLACNGIDLDPDEELAAS